MCYVWPEVEGDTTANSFASCLDDYLESYILDHPVVKEIIVISHGCGNQNRNSTESNALSQRSVISGVTITQKYLEGHTYMEVDSVHSCIERNMEVGKVNVPADYINVIKGARKRPGYKVKYLEHDFFSNYSPVKSYSAIRPGIRVGDPTVHDIRALQYYPDGTISYKLRFTDDWQPLPRKNRIGAPGNPVPLHADRLPINQSKFKHLQDLKKFLPQDYHSYYDNLPQKS